jgi:uncharacterized membrane protein
MASRGHVVYRAVLVAGALALAAVLWPLLPERMPTHWGLDGRVDGWGSRFEGAILLPLLALGIWLMAEVLPRIDPRRANFAKMRGAYDVTISAAVTMLVGLDAAMLANAVGYPVPVSRIAAAGTGVLLVVLGNLLPRARPNWWFGIRTPWTLSNDRVWTRTHRVGGYLMVAAGLALVVAALALPPAWSAGAAVAAAVVAGLGSAAYSYVAWRQETRS